MIRKILLASFCVFCATCFSGGVANAIEPGDIVIQVNPADQEVELTPGESTDSQVKVTNLGRLPFSFTPLAKPYQVLNDSYDPDFATENSYTKLHSWLTFEQSEYHLEPGAEVIVNFHIEVPEDAPAGGQYAAVILETRDSMDVAATFQTINQIASLLYAHVAGETHEMGLLMTHSIPFLRLSSPIITTTNIKNDGNIDFRASHTMTIWNFFTGEEIINGETVANDGTTPGSSNPPILPATSRFNQLSWDGTPALGLFRVRQTISFLDEDYTFEQLVFVCPFWLVLLLLFFIFLLIFWIILSVRSRKKQRPQVV